MKNLNNVTWGQFKLGDLFDVSTSKGIDKTKVNINEQSGTFDFIGRTPTNNGIQGYLEKLDFEPNKKDTFSVIQIGENIAQFRKREWYGSQNLFVLTPNNRAIVENKIFMITVINKMLTKYSGGYSNYPTKEKLKNDVISLPINTNGEPDYEFMKQFIKNLEKKYFIELDNHLQARGLSVTKLTPIEEKALDDFASLTWGYFKIEDLFEVKSSAKKFNAGTIDIKETQTTGTFPYIVRISANNGIRGYVKESDEYLNEKNTIAFGQDTATIYYQEQPYFTGDKIKVLKSTSAKFNRNIAMFMITSMNKVFSQMSWGMMFNEKIIKTQNISLPQDPTDPTKPDYQYMETYIKAIEKRTIKNVVDFKDQQLATTKKVV